MGDDITIGVTEIVNNIEVTAQPNDQIVDISVVDNTDEVTLNITPTVIEINVNKGSSYAKWGTILGTLSDQEDLQEALDLKANDNAVVHLTGNENISGTKTFGNTIYANGGTGEGEYAIEIDKSFEGEAIRVKNSSLTTFTLGLNGAVTALRYVKTGGTSSQFLKADGSVDSNVYALDSVVVKLTGDQSISGKKSFNLVQTGYNLSLITSDIFSDGIIESNNGMLRLVNNTTSADLFRLESDGIVFAKAFKKDGGTSSEFLMADGSVTTSGLSGTTNYIPKFTSSSSIGNSLIYEIGSTIGIGTTSPFSALHIKRNASELLRITRGSVSDFSFDLGASNDLYIKNNGIGTTPLTILGSGNVGIGTTIPVQPLDVNGNIRGTGLLVENTTGNQQVSFRKSGSMRYAIGTEVGAGSTNDWSIYNYVYGGTSFIIYGNNNYQFFGSNVSDIRAKEKIVDLDFDATEKVMALQPKSYYMKNDSKQIRYGLIAQEVNEVLPDLVCGDIEGDDFVGLDYNGVIPVLIKAIQELKAEIEILKNK